MVTSFQWKFTTEFYLGPTAEEKLFAMSMDFKYTSGRQTLILHDGPAKEHPPLATCESDMNLLSKPFVATIQLQPGA
jgi:hypothetical protein